MNNILWNKQMSYIAFGILLSLLILYSIYSGVVYIFFRDKYKGIRFTTRNITYITMLSAASVTMTVIVSYIIPVTVLPPIRVSFEGLMVKISGYIFGPIVGFMAGIITDLLCMLFIPTYFHVAYLITIASYGFVAGMTSVFFRTVKTKKWLLFLCSNILIIGFISFFTYFTTTATDSQLNHLPFPKYIIILILIISGTVSLFFQLIVFIVFVYYRHKNKHTFLNTSKVFDDSSMRTKQPLIDENIIGITFLALITEYYVSALIVPWGDTSLFEKKGYGVLLLYRIFEAPVKIFFNTIIIYVSYRAVSPLIKRD